MKYVMGIKECIRDEYWVMYAVAESLYCTPDTNLTVYVNYIGIEINKIQT